MPPEETNTIERSSRRLTLIICLALVAATLAIYWEVQEYDFVDYDDHLYVVDNHQVRSGLTGEAVKWAFWDTYASFWHPLTWLSHMLDYRLYGLNPQGHHFNNLLLHIANTLFLFLALKRMTGAVWRSALVAALFALHPLHVESVAWISERKDVLSTFFWMLTMWTYALYVEKQGVWRYMTTLLFFALGLMAKPVLVTLPFVLLLLDFWPLGRIHHKGKGKEATFPWTLLIEKLPFFLLAAVSCIVAVQAQQGGGSLIPFEDLPMKSRFANAVVSYFIYIRKMVWPVDLACFYPHPVSNLSLWQISIALLFLMGVSFVALRSATRCPYLSVGWLWYLGTLVPVIGLVQVGTHAMADRYTYVPLIGIFIMLAWGIPQTLTGLRHMKTLIPVITILLLCILAAITRVHLSVWRNTDALFEQAIRVVPNNFLAHFHLAIAQEKEGRLDEAFFHLSEALRIRPGFQLGHHLMGNVLFKKGSLDEAIHHFFVAVEIDPKDIRAHNNLGCALLRQGRVEEAIHHFREVLKIRPDDNMARRNISVSEKKLSDSDMLSFEAMKKISGKTDKGNESQEQGRAVGPSMGAIY